MFPDEALSGEVLGDVADQQGPGQGQAGVFEVEIFGELLHQQDGGGEEEEGEDSVDVEVGGPEVEQSALEAGQTVDTGVVRD